METSSKYDWRKKRLFFIPLMIIGAVVMTTLVMTLWNWLMPTIFGLITITFWQAGGLLLLSKLLFTGFNFNKKGTKPPFVNTDRRERFMNMTDEEKEKFKNQWKERCSR